MKLAKWASVAEITSALAVILTLLILIFEVRDNTQAIERNYQQESFRLGAEGRGAIFEIDGLADIIVKRSNEESLTDVEEVKLNSYAGYLLRIFEIAFNLFESGDMSQSQAEILQIRVINSVNSLPALRDEIARCLECYTQEYLDWLEY